MTESTWDVLDAALQPPRVLCHRFSASGGTLASAAEPPGWLHGASGCLAWWHRVVTSKAGTASCSQQRLPSHGMPIQCWFPSRCLREQFPLQMQPLQNSTAWQERGLATPLPFPSSVSKSPGLVTLERSKDLPQGHASSAKALSLLLLASSPATAGKLMQEWLVLK